MDWLADIVIVAVVIYVIDLLRDIRSHLGDTRAAVGRCDEATAELLNLAELTSHLQRIERLLAEQLAMLEANHASSCEEIRATRRSADEVSRLLEILTERPLDSTSVTETP